MKKSSLLIFILLFIAGLAIWSARKDKTVALNTRIVFAQELEQYGVLEHSLDALITSLFEDAGKEMGISDIFGVNKPYKESDVNIYVINFEKLKKEKQLAKILQFKRDDLINLCENNFIAIPPGMVLIDSNFFNHMMLEWMNDQLAFGQLMQGYTSDKRNLSDDELILESERVNLISVYKRLGNFDVHLNKKYEVFSMEEYGRVMGNTLSSVPAMISEKPYYLFFLPIVAHEIAHLKSDASGSYKSKNIDDVASLLNQQLVRKQKIAEDEAEDVAVSVIERYLDKLDKANNKNYFYFKCQSLLTFCTYMRDLLLYETFQGFRGLNARDALVTITQKENAKYNDEYEKSIGFIAYERVKEAHWNPAPLMTEEEFEAIMNKLKGKGSSLSHKHIFLRVVAIENCIKKYDVPINIVGTYGDLLSAYEKADIAALQKRGEYKELGIPQSQILEGIQDIDLKKVINYAESEGRIAIFKNGYGRIDLIGPETDIQVARLVVSLRDSKDEIIVGNILNMGVFISNFYENAEQGLNMAQAIHSKLRANRESLPVITELIGNNLLSAHYLNNTNYYVVEVVALAGNNR